VAIFYVALASGSTAAWLRSSAGVRRAINAAAGIVFVGLALRLMLAKRQPA
jgi:threonine/homoserine/homoserine lactone efflux protein